MKIVHTVRLNNYTVVCRYDIKPIHWNIIVVYVGICLVLTNSNNFILDPDTGVASQQTELISPIQSTYWTFSATAE